MSLAIILSVPSAALPSMFYLIPKTMSLLMAQFLFNVVSLTVALLALVLAFTGHYFLVGCIIAGGLALWGDQRWFAKKR